MTKQRKLAIIAAVIIVVFVLMDQLLKCWVVRHMALYQTIPLLGEWLNLHYILNEGMAFGLSFGENIGKLALSLIRIGVVGFLLYYMIKRIRQEKIDALAVSVLSLIIAGALGNIIDSAFYGLIFQGKPFMFGSVVDMFYIRLFLMPEWFPLFGGEYFFPAIFNIADSCVTVGIIVMLCFYKHFFREEKEGKDAKKESEKEVPVKEN